MQSFIASFTALCRRKSKSASIYGRVFSKWAVISVLTGLIGGTVGSLFHLSVNWVTHLREIQPWLMCLMPLAGVLIVWLYHVTKMEGKGTNDIIHSIHFGKKVPIMLTPVIFLATVLTHIVGGSAGREVLRCKSAEASAGMWEEFCGRMRRISVWQRCAV